MGERLHTSRSSSPELGRSQRLSLKHTGLAGSLPAVNRLHRMMALVMLAAWLPAASLCLAECAGFIERGDCCADESGGNADAAAHPCCFLASGSYKSDTHRPLVLAPDVFATARLASLISIPPSSDGLALSPPALSPPDLPVTWQFSFRAALPPRAPSLAS